MLQQLEAVDTVRREVAPRIEQKRKAEFGQFMTPSSVARFMASLFPPSTLPTCRLLDAGAGVGALSCAFLDRWTAGGFGFESVEATGRLTVSVMLNFPACLPDRPLAWCMSPLSPTGPLWGATWAKSPGKPKCGWLMRLPT